jgi:hypothetical protein
MFTTIRILTLTTRGIRTLIPTTDGLGNSDALPEHDVYYVPLFLALQELAVP